MNSSKIKERPQGYVRNRTEELLQYQESLRNKGNRSKKDSASTSSEFKGSMRSKNQNLRQNSNTCFSATGSQILLPFENGIEMQTPVATLPPLWIDIFEKAQENIKEAEAHYKEIKQISQERIQQIDFDETSNKPSQQDQKIHSLTVQAAKLLKDTEKQIKQIDLVAKRKEQTDTEREIRVNAKTSLAQQVQDLLVSLKKQEKYIHDKLKDFNNVNGGEFLHRQAAAQLNFDEQGSQEGLQEQMMEQVAADRNQQINQLVDMINQLADLFQSMSALVIQQGTLLDRIDFNIDSTLKNTQEANQQLTKALKHQQSPTAQRCIQILICLIILFSIVLTFKYSGNN